MTAAAVASLDESLILRAVDGVTFAGQKAARVLQVAEVCVDEYGGDVPVELAAVRRLPGVGPKVAHLLMQVAWGRC